MLAGIVSEGLSKEVTFLLRNLGREGTDVKRAF